MFEKSDALEWVSRNWQYLLANQEAMTALVVWLAVNLVVARSTITRGWGPVPRGVLTAAAMLGGIAVVLLVKWMLTWIFGAEQSASDKLLDRIDDRVRIAVREEMRQARRA